MINPIESQCPFGHSAVAIADQTESVGSFPHCLEAPVADWVDLSEMRQDPYPIYQRLREETPVAWIPGLNRYLVTSFEGCREAESNQDVFSANVGGGMARALGRRPMLRKDDPEHAAERTPINPTMRPKNLKEAWSSQFELNAQACLALLREKGPECADLNADFAAPLAAKNLIDLLGLGDVDIEDMLRWSTDFIDGIANVHDLPDVWERCESSQQEVDMLLVELIRHYRAHPNPSIISAFANSGMDPADIIANVKLTISGGVNEPKHMITNTVWALDQHPEQRDHVLQDGSMWDTVFNETVRWISPIGMAPRQTTRATILDGYALPEHAPIGLGFASANRDHSHFTADPDRFDLSRPKEPHMAFGSGPHICAGQWAARISIGQIAVPLLYRELPGLRVDTDRSPAWDGWVFRGLTTLPVTWS
jgi:cytochrome P450